MECPNCGSTDLLPRFKCCPECGYRLANGQIIPPKEQKIAPPVTSEQPRGDGTAEKQDTGAGKEEQVKGKIYS